RVAPLTPRSLNRCAALARISSRLCSNFAEALAPVAVIGAPPRPRCQIPALHTDGRRPNGHPLLHETLAPLTGISGARGDSADGIGTQSAGPADLADPRPTTRGDASSRTPGSATAPPIAGRPYTGAVAARTRFASGSTQRCSPGT